MPLDKKNILDKLALLESYIKEVKSLRKFPEREFAVGKITEAAAERRLEKASQCTIDLANHIVAELGLGRPENYKHIFDILAKNGILSSRVVEKLKKMVGMRNVIVHDYAEVKTKEIFKAVQKEIEDLEEFAQEIEGFLEKRETKKDK